MKTLAQALEELAIVTDELSATSERATRAEKRLAAAEKQATKDAAQARCALEELAADGDSLFSELSSKLVADAARGAIAAAGGSAALLLPFITERTRVDRKTRKIEVLDDRGRRDWNFDGGDVKPASIADLVKSLKRRPDLALAFDKPAATAKTKDGRNGETLTEQSQRIKAERSTAPSFAVRGNPYRKESWNLTGQSMLVRSDPTRAAALRAEAEGA